MTYILQNSEKSIIDKQTEIIGPANAKSKEAQAMMKTLEGQLATYFASVIDLVGSEQKSHRKIIDYELIDGESCIVIRRDSFEVDYSSLENEIINTLKDRRGRGFGWLIQHQSESTDSFLEEKASFSKGFTTTEKSDNLNVMATPDDDRHTTMKSSGIVKVRLPFCL